MTQKSPTLDDLVTLKGHYALQLLCQPCGTVAKRYVLGSRRRYR